jgi:hypothetical protein
VPSPILLGLQVYSGLALVVGAMSRGQGKRSQSLVKAAYDILLEIHPASVRALCYRLFVAGLIQNMEKSSTNSVSRLLRIAREVDEIPWEWIVDESREAETANRWTNPDEIIDSAVKAYRRDYWQEQAYRVVVWSEKGTVRGTLGPVLDEYGVTFRVMHGYASATVINDVAEMSTQSDKPLIVLYVGDWDPSGKHMSDVDLPRRLWEYGGKLELRRVALVRDNLKSLPSFEPETKRKDPRYRWFREHVKTKCYELDALPPPELRNRVESEICSLIDLGLWNHAKQIERVEVESMRAFHKSWQATISSRQT